MGIIRKLTMPLLSTLAALVIIVHSAEEDNQSDYRKDLRPRIVDTGIQSYEQPWRVVDSEQVMTKFTQTDIWNNNSTEESQKHRRTRRKRKRRPHTPLNDSLFPQEAISYPEEPQQQNVKVDLTSKEQLADTPKRRRKKPETQSAQRTEVSIQRPLRRRGQRRKRPSLNNWSEFEKLNGYRSEENSPATTAINGKKDIPHINQNDDSTQYISNTGIINNSELIEDLIAREVEDPEKKETKDEFRLISNEKDSHIMKHHDPYLQEDKSLSEISLEVMHRADGMKNNYENENLRRKLKDKSAQVFDGQDKAKLDGSIDPITLKDILRRSNGTSLSEILQLHNLSLTDLLNGKENALSIFESENKQESKDKQNVAVNIVNDAPLIEVSTDNNKQLVKNDKEDNLLLHLETKYVTYPANEYSTTIQSSHRIEKEEGDKKEDIIATTPKQENNINKIISIRRYASGAHRKLHMRPLINSTHKSPLSRDLVALNARNFFNQRRNVSKSIEWRNVIPSMINISTAASDMNKRIEISTVRITTDTNQLIPIDVDNQNKSVLLKDENKKLFDIDVGTDTMFSTTTVKLVTVPENPVLFNETQYSTSTVKPLSITPGSQRYNFNNRMKKKRRRQKNTTTELPLNKVIIYSPEKENFPLSADIIARTQKPKPMKNDEDFVTILEDFMTTENPIQETTLKSVKAISSTTASPPPTTHRINEKTESTDIDEIFKDIQISARLSKILLERNMTLRELVEHRERGSSHIHLADIFHNASKEPNPSEPFLSKSAIEPISKEIYPLRAILEANAHDSTIKPSINDPNTLRVGYINVPIVMDFGNNVNENAENMGIMSLFNNLTKIVNHNNTLDKDFKVNSYETNIAMNTTHKEVMPTIRQNRVLNDLNNEDDVVSWNEIFSLMRRNYKNETKDLFESIRDETSVPETPTKTSVEDADDDSLSFLEDLEHHKIFDSNIYTDSNDRLNIETLEKTDAATGILEKIPSQTKSITVLTASIAGLAMVLFLLVYAVFKWKQHKVIANKEHSFCNERIPTPVFENRKAQRNNSSTRSISPMLSTSNIYTLNTLDSHNGKDSPEYMWDTLRKPFQ